MAHDRMAKNEKFLRLIKIILLLAVVSAYFFGYVLNSKSSIFYQFEAMLLSLQWMLPTCIAIWCAWFFFLTFGFDDLLLIGLLLITIVAYFISYTEASRAADAVILLAGVTLGRGARFALEADRGWKIEDGKQIVGDEVTSLISKPGSQLESPYVVSCFLVGLIGLLAFAAWWHLDMAGAYHGPRWMGLWNNPNIYGMLMGAGVVLAIGMRAAKAESGKRKSDESANGADSRRFFLPSFMRKSAKSADKNVSAEASTITRGTRAVPIFLVIAAGMMAVGLVMSYSRGAWVATSVGLLYLAWSYGKLKWLWVLPGLLAMVVVVVVFWHSTADTDQWYLKRMDLSRPSAQHRVAAWRGAVQIMRDHPFGVGWNNAVGVYGKQYSPPEGGASAITTNDYLMLGTELGLPGLVCFVAYVALQLRVGRWKLEDELEKFQIPNSEFRIKTACRAGAITLLVVFWFDGGLFTLATAAMFWVLLELGAETQFRPRMDTDEHGFSKEKLVARSRPGRTARSLNCLEQLLICVHRCPSVVKDL